MKFKEKCLSIIFVLILSFISLPAFAQNKSVPNECWISAAQRHQVDVYLLYAIAWVESKHDPLAIGKNKNGSFDLGLMQINTIWLPELAKYGISKTHLLDGCASIFVGAWIMSKNFKRYGYTWKAIGAYNSATPSIGYKYAQKVYAAHKKIVDLVKEQKRI